MIRFIVISLFTVVLLSACGKRASRRADSAAYFQTPPPDMVFVPGNGGVPSFYMGVTEETNLNYNIYLTWLEKTFSNYPFVKSWAEPKSRDLDSISRLNDPFYKEYFTHPSYAYYPVVGVTWLQAMEYLSWKGDRLNEAIMMETALFKKENLSRAVQEDNFNLEAYLNGQYDGLVKDRVEKPQSFDGQGLWHKPWQKVEMKDGIFFQPMRLPTEAEWEYVHARQGNVVTEPPSFWKNNHPFGDDYYLLEWDEANFWGIQQAVNTVKHIGKIQQGIYPQAISPAQSKPGVMGIANMQSSVDEWLLDSFNRQPVLRWDNVSVAMAANGMRIMYKHEYWDWDGFLREKNQLGRFPFIYYGFSATGEGIRYRRYTHLQHDFISPKTDTVYVDLDTMAMDSARYYKNTGYQPPVFFMRVKAKWGESFERLGHNKKGFYYLIYSEYLDHKKVNTAFLVPVKRVIRGAIRRGEDENTSSLNTGFRAVMWHSGYPLVNKKYKVKWK